MTFDGSPRDSRHGVGGFPKLTQQPTRNNGPSGLAIAAGFVLVTTGLGAVLLVAILIGSR